MTIDCNAQFGVDYDGTVHSLENLIKKMDDMNTDLAAISCISGNISRIQNDSVHAAFKKFLNRVIPVAMINPVEDTAVEELHRCLGDLKFKAIRFHAHRHGYYPENCPKLHDLLKAAQGYQCPVIVHTGLSTLGTPQQWSFYAQDYPEISFIFNHMGLFDFGYGCVDIVKNLSNVYLETSGQFEVQILHRALNELPIDRLCFGTDWPFKIAEIERSKFDFFHLKKDQADKLFGGNARKLFKL